MTDLHERFAQLDDIETEDLWREIELRYEGDVKRVIRPVERPRRRFAVAAAAAFLLAILLGAAILVTQFQEEEPPIITQVPTPTSLPAPTSTIPGIATTLPAISLGDLLDWSLVPVLSEIDVECAEVYGQLEELCLTPFGTVLRDVLAVDDRLWAVGHDGSTGNWDGMIITSNDGEAWERVPDPDGIFGGPGNQEIHAITAGENGLLAVGSTDCSAIGISYPSSTDRAFGSYLLQRCPQAWISQAGMEWEKLDSRAIHDRDGVQFSELLAREPFAPDPSFEARGYEMRDVAWTGSEFVAVGEAIWTSEDGREWIIDPLPSSSAAGNGECSPQCRANSVSSTAEGMIAAGRDATMAASPHGGKASLWVSSDLSTWSQIQVDLPADSDLSAIVESATGPILSGGQGGRAIPMSRYTGAGWGIEGPIIVMGRSLSEMTDTVAGSAFDGSGRANAVIVDEDRIVVVGSRIASSFLLEGGAARVWGSLDGGSSWEPYPVDDYSLFGVYTSATTGAEMLDVIAFNGRLIAVGYYSTDGAVWVGTWTD